MKPEGTSDIEQVLAGGGEMGALIRAIDWSETPVGLPSQWPQSLRTVLSVCLASRFPMLIWWGPEMIQFYNDAYRPILGATKHPRSMGQRGPECWAEIWNVIGPMAESVRETGQATWSDDFLLVMDRNRYIEETYFTFSYSPIRDESGGIGGILVTCTETTARVLGERRLRTLRDLGTQTSEGETVEKAVQIAAEILAHNPLDLPFVLLYLLESEGLDAHLVGSARVGAGTPFSPSLIKLIGPDTGTAVWPLQQVAQTGQPSLVDHLPSRFNLLPAGPWPEPTHTAMVLPIAAQAQDRPTGFLVAGVNSRRQLDDDYRSFLQLVAGHIATTIAKVRAYEAERQRVEALMELDRAKTAFFSNISHEFRTPLTLLLGPLEDILNNQVESLTPRQRQELELVQRNSLRLLKLVNTLLDFSRIEANRLQAFFQPLDLTTFTAELASVFRSAIERAGLRLEVDCPPLPEPVYVDREMWEKIVLNLLSNAFKFTFEGKITVSLRALPMTVELIIADTGVGIPADQLPHIFERFYRARNTRTRNFEGTGIGLALVQEFIRLHEGQIEVTSEVGRGTTFKIQIPRGAAHLPAKQIEFQPDLASTAPGAKPYLEESLCWLPDPVETPLAVQAEALGTDSSDLAATSPISEARILLAEDNADMRDYLHRLLAAHWRVETAGDGLAALAATRERPPDLILADVMMPNLDGFGLLRELRADPHTQTIPIILLSARAGEEAIVEGLKAGADDYLIKPFLAQELLARVGAHLALARLRGRVKEELAERARLALLRAEVSELLASNKPLRQALQETVETLVQHLNCALARVWLLNRAEAVLELRASAGLYTHLDGPHSRVPLGEFKFGHIARSGELHLTNDVLHDPNISDPEWARREGIVTFASYPLLVEGRVMGVMALFSRQALSQNLLDELKPLSQTIGQFIDRKLAERALRESEARFRNMADNAQVMIWVTEPDGACTYLSKSWYEFTGQTSETGLGFGRLEAVYPADRQKTEQIFLGVRDKRQAFQVEYRLWRKDGEYRWVIDSTSPRLSPEGEFLGYIGSITDIHERKREEMAERLLAEAGQILMTSLDYTLALTALARLIVSQLASWCTINLMAEDGTIHLVKAAHREPVNVDLIYELVHLFPLNPAEPRGTARALNLGQAQLYTDFWEELPTSRLEDPKYRRLIQFLGDGPTIIVPLMARGRILGSMTLVAEPAHRYDENDLALAEELARRMALALDNARAYEAEQQARQKAEQSTRRITTLQKLTAALSKALTPAQVARVVVEQGFAILGAGGGWVALFDETNQTFETLDAIGYPLELLERWQSYPLSAAAPIPEAVRTGAPVFIESLEAMTSRYPNLTQSRLVAYQAMAAVPLVVEERILGAIGLSFAEPQPFTPEDRAFIVSLAQQCAQALERARLYEVEQQARLEAEANQQRQALLAEMRERNRLAQELHDTVAQALGYLNLRVAMTQTLLEEDQVDAARGSLQELKQVIGETYSDVREEISYLRAKALPDMSFMELLNRYLDKYRRFYNLDIRLVQDADPALFEFSGETTSQLVRTIQEALINIRKHARVNKATVRLGRENSHLQITIEDQGQGFQLEGVKAKPSSFGLQIMRERVESVGGSLEIESAPGRGTRVVLKTRGQ
jgi:PAS domain S-box-containing protein